MSVESLERELRRALAGMGVEEGVGVTLERPRNPEHGDWATNVALTLAKPLRRAPRQIAEELAARLDAEAAGVSSVEVAGPGFLNFRLRSDYLQDSLRALVESGEAFGRSEAGGGRPVMIEFVSANPTGPLHIGHGRQAALGDAVSELLAWTGWKVHREFYYNDAGEQINRLARSVWARYQQHFGREVPVPEDGYHGEYVLDIARAVAQEAGERWLDDDSPAALDAMRVHAVRLLRQEQNRDLDGFRVHFDEFYLESSLYSEGRVEETIRRLRETGLAYEHEGALWLRTTDFGDDKDRVMVRRNGQPTYFVPDVAYHLTKWERGFHRAINVQGADHHGTTARVRAGLQALGLPAGYPEWVLHQMVTVVRGGQEVKFSKRAGDYVTFRDLYDEVGVDVARYFFLMRRAEAQLVFDLDLALDQSEKNPVYKVQYAHARMHSIFRKADVAAAGIDPAAADLALLERPAEQELIKALLRFPEVIQR
jgi:arginyl-tRNA synthetase